MGLFSRKNKEDKRKDTTLSSQMNTQSNSVSEYDPQVNYTTRGLELDYIEQEPKFGQFYDTTKLIVEGRNINFPDSNVYDCCVSWYGQDDCQLFDKKSGKFVSPRSENFESVLVQLDLHLLETDPIYKKRIITLLLNEARVKRYLDAGMMAPDEIAKAQADGNDSIALCGRYIGGMAGKGKNYQKFFDPEIGKKAHNLPDMIEKRQKSREMKEIAKQKKIAELRAQIDDLESQK